MKQVEMLMCPYLCVCVCAGCECVLEWPAAALAGPGLVHGHLLTHHPAGPVLQQPGRSALRGALGSHPPADSGSVQQPAEGAAACSQLAGGHLLQVDVDAG